MRILVTGAGGLIGTLLRGGLSERFALTGVDRRRVRDKGVRRGDATSLASIESMLDDVDAIVDLAGVASVDASWDVVWRNNIPASRNALEAAYRRGVGRVVFASSNHVTGMYERDDPYARIVAGAYDGLDPASLPLIDARAPVRPDGAYAVGKVVGEACGKYYSDVHGLSVVCLRIGTVNAEDRARTHRELATLLSHADLVRLVECALTAPADLRFGVYYGVSDNTWRFWDLADARHEIGYEPQDNAERFRAELARPS